MNLFRLLFLMLLIPEVLCAQAPQLPSMHIITEKAKNILSWTNQFEGVKSIAIQRSTDSLKNYITIGFINAPRKGLMSYTDESPMLGKNNYRLSIGFSGDMEWHSNVYKVIMDSALIAKSNSGALLTGTTNSSSVVGQESTDFYYTPSTRIFTNPYTGHINIEIPDVQSKRYSLRFYDPENIEVLRLARITKPTLILDKNNFNARGVYHFKLFDGITLFETGYITIY